MSSGQGKKQNDVAALLKYAGGYRKLTWLGMGLSGVAMILLSVTEIAGQCGYSNASKFAACFRRITGFTPGEWRRSKGITFGDDVPQ